jgi:hypothetical protein
LFFVPPAAAGINFPLRELRELLFKFLFGDQGSIHERPPLISGGYSATLM